MEISPDNIILFHIGFFPVSATIFFTWLVMILLAVVSRTVTRNLTSDGRPSRWQNLLEVIVSTIRNQIREVSQQDPDRYLSFVGTLFIFIAASNLLAVIPGFQPPTGSLSTTTALAVSVFVAVPFYGIAAHGLRRYLRQYLQPTPLMLPFNIIGELSRTLALAMRLYGNIMSGAIIIAILLSIVPLFFPIVMQALGLLTGFIQAYIFFILAVVYIASASRVHRERESEIRKGEQ